MIDPDDACHQAWFDKVRKLLGTAPDGATFTMREPFAPREVDVEEFIQFQLADQTYHSYDTAGAARGMWAGLVRVCGSRLGMDVPTDREEAETFPLPLLVLKQLKLVHFEATHIKTETRQRLLKFIEGLH